MTTIERTAYPRSGGLATAHELVERSQTSDDVTWARDRTCAEEDACEILGRSMGANKDSFWPGEADPALTWVAAMGAADIAAFLSARRASLFSKSPARAGGSAVSLALWTALRISSRHSQLRPGSRRAQRLATGLALACGLGNLALFAVHLRIGRGRLRSLPGAALGSAALVLGARRLVPR